MSKKVGLWVNHKKAVIVSITDDGEERTIITSRMEHYIPYSSPTFRNGSPPDMHNKRYWDQVNEYYNKIIAQLQDAEALQIFGPGEAKSELKKRLDDLHWAEYSITLETIGNLTDHQIAEKVRERFPARSQYDIF